MNLLDIALGAVNAVNPDIPVTWRKSSGSTTDAYYKSTPTYTDVATTAQAQELSARELVHMNNLNIQGILRKFYLDGDVHAVDRASGLGGDLIVTQDTGASVTWLVVSILENFNGNWTACVGQKQVNA